MCVLKMVNEKNVNRLGLNMISVAWRLYFQTKIAIPVKINVAPNNNLEVIGSLSIKNDKSNVTTILALSIDAT